MVNEMHGEIDRLALAMLTLQLHPEATNEQLAQVLGLQRALSAVFWRVKAQEVLASGQVVCELCGKLFPASEPFYEPGVCAYCAVCCQW